MTVLSSPLQLHLTPLRIPEAIMADEMVRGSFQTATQSNGLRLLLHPGEPSEMIVQMQNRSRQRLRVQMRVEGNFPLGWYQVGGLEDGEIAPGRAIDAVIRFQPPENFLENQTALQPGQVLALDYECRILVSYTAAEAGATPTGASVPLQEAFALHLRPRSLYLDFLPAVYREVDFIGRFLAIFEQTFEPAVHTLETLWAYLDPLTTSQAMLPFLAHWMAFPLDPRWSVEQQRRIIRKAMELYRWRGTRRGLRLYLHLYTGLPLDEAISDEAEKHISITEQIGAAFVLKNNGESSRLGESLLGGGRPFHFLVRLRQTDDPIDEALVRQIINQVKPAFSTYDLRIESL